jgi:hypothetical protein
MNSNDGNDGGSAPFRTGRMRTLNGLHPSYSPGEFVFLQGTVPGFEAGTRFKVLDIQSTGPGEYRYQISAGEHKLWVDQAAVRSSAPQNSAPAPAQAGEPSRNSLSVTQRMQTLTLSQRMAALGVEGGQPDAGATQRLVALKPDQALKKAAESGQAPDIDGPVTGALGFEDKPRK